MSRELEMTLKHAVVARFGLKSRFFCKAAHANVSQGNR
jgi:hypothetical protein